MYVEATLGLPHEKSDLGDFKHNVRVAKNAGATAIRTSMLSGRRYEMFDTAKAFSEFAEQQWIALAQAEPILRNHSMKLAIENHKDWRLDEMLMLLQRIRSEFIGVCVDTGNNIALLDNPMNLVEALAPYAHSVHLKDMGVEEYEDGFLLSEVPLGEGYLDIPKMVKVLREAKPDLQFSLEMITRDPLTIPCLTRKYWATFSDLPGIDLARTLATVRANKPAKPLPRFSHLDAEQRRNAEE
jgi:sugar phosphate isomerase/epimerase